MFELKSFNQEARIVFLIFVLHADMIENTQAVQCRKRLLINFTDLMHYENGTVLGVLSLFNSWFWSYMGKRLINL
jgi:hypothetical protein